jgi:hypothetical protein
MVDEKPQASDETPAPANQPPPAPEPAPEPAVGVAAADAIADPPAAEEPQSAIEREHWLRSRFEKEHEVTLALVRLLLAGISHEGRAKRFWRWLIDDFRSERRLAAAPDAPAGSDRMLIRRVLAWLGDRGF